MKIVYSSDSKENDYTNVDFFASHCVYMKSLFRACSFDLFVSHQIRNRLWKFCLIRVTRKIEQRQRNDNSTYEDSKNRFTHHFRRLSSHISENTERRNACSIHSSSFISFANRRQKSIDKARALYIDQWFLHLNQK
jgi:hypothetical protein